MPPMKDWFKTYGEWLRMGIVIAAVIASQYLNTNYVRADQYRADREKDAQTREATAQALSNIRDTTQRTDNQLTNLRDQLFVMHSKQLEDHETRMRELERRLK